jgi:hypothetical protein
MRGCLFALSFIGAAVAGVCFLIVFLAWASQHVHGPG